MEIYEVKQNVVLANGINEWMVLGSYQHRHLAIEFAERLVKNGMIKNEDLAITFTTIVNVEWRT
jgi:hypothetical protein